MWQDTWSCAKIMLQHFGFPLIELQKCEIETQFMLGNLKGF
ncbi:hypothetical protein DDD_3371 [Nonlabens dokdonensis DSW-6]|uniref:Uncharacterized protein n=1 Tax=Nonlabens dokdonensis (strain DSM 17205 / KCTC 12402 / DSW-6) TaxID=592029 RepID=L7WHM9_NONDD|nr:hypothetical protein DDD_3371 [Nonlabens dokdonensis DSW-6]